MTDKEYIQIARYLDNETDIQLKESELTEARIFKSVETKLKNLAIEPVPKAADQHMAQRLKEISISSNGTSKKVNKSLLNGISGIAVVLIGIVILYWFVQNNNTKTTFHGTPNVLIQLSELYNQELTVEETNWLRALIVTESNPNIKVLALDILSENSIPFDEALFATILDEKYATVQMAFLDHFNANQNNGQLEKYLMTLQKFKERKDLEKMVALRTNELLNSFSK